VANTPADDMNLGAAPFAFSKGREFSRVEAMRDLSTDIP
jgi:hypothetical protein